MQYSITNIRSGPKSPDESRSCTIDRTPDEIDGLIEFLRLASGLKTIKRQGWIDRGVADPESAADHSWGVALLAWLVALEQDQLDTRKIMLMALVHDVPEALAGDATPFDRHRDERGAIPPDHFEQAPVYDLDETSRKHELERVALHEMVAGLPKAAADEIKAAWKEYNVGESPEARLVRQVDKLETLLQAELYREAQPEIIIHSFQAGTDRDVDDPALRRILERILNPPEGERPSQSSSNRSSSSSSCDESENS